MRVSDHARFHQISVYGYKYLQISNSYINKTFFHSIITKKQVRKRLQHCERAKFSVFKRIVFFFSHNLHKIYYTQIIR